MVNIYSEFTSPRLLYVLDEIFIHRLGMPYKITQNELEYEGINEGGKINYSPKNISGFQILPAELLKQSDILDLMPDFSDNAEKPFLFLDTSEFGCDIFSMVFWFLSRYEEYLPHEKDNHGRFLPNTILPEHFRNQPALDIALNLFYNFIGLKHIGKYAIYPTIDVDIAFAHKGRPPAIWIGGLLRFVLNGDIQKAMERIGVLFGKKDPSDNFDYMNKILLMHQERSRVFIQNSKRSKYDRTISIQNKSFANVLFKIALQFETGIHPGYFAGQSAEGIAMEKRELELHLGKTISRSRHHFLKIQLPETYRNLITAGIIHDYSMGYAHRTGFRASTGLSFRFFDLEKNIVTSLVIHPFSAMDVTLKNYLKLTRGEALKELKRIKQICLENGSPFSFIFHNESLSDSGEWLGYREIFEACLN